MLHFHIDTERCVQCGECAAVCPMSIIDLAEDWPRIQEFKESRCLQCQHCLAVCPTAALSILGVDPDRCAGIGSFSPDAVENLIKSRRSVRHYRPEAVDSAILDRLLEVVAYAPTGKNQRQVRFTLIDDPAVMDAIRIRTMAGLRKAVAENALPPGLDFFASLIKPFERGQDIIYRFAPHMIIASQSRDVDYPYADPFIALSEFELMAHSLGLGTLWCGFAHWALRFVVPELGLALGIPEDHQTLAVMMFGYPLTHYARVVQRDVRNVRRVSLADLEPK